MKRTFSEWGLIVSTLSLVASSMLWGGSYLTDRTTDHLQVATTGRSQDSLHFLLRGGSLWLFNQFEVDASGAVLPSVVAMRTPVAPSSLRMGRCALPGFELDYCRLPPFGYLMWSVRVSLWLPSLASLLGVAWFLRRIGRARRIARDGGPAAALTSPHDPPAGGP